MKDFKENLSAKDIMLIIVLISCLYMLYEAFSLLYFMCNILNVKL